MKKCKHCGIVIADPAYICPLCQCILSQEPDKLGLEDAEPAYPYADKRRKRIRFAMNIYIFAAVAAWVIILLINLFMHHQMWWTFLIGACMVYGYVTLWYSVQTSRSYKLKLSLQALLAFLLLLLLDFLTGFQGWSLAFVFPAFVAIYDLSVLILMVIDKHNWQSFILMQMLAVGLSLILFVLYFFGLFYWLYAAFGILIFTLIVFVGTLVVGGQRAREEVARRFHM